MNKGDLSLLNVILCFEVILLKVSACLEGRDSLTWEHGDKRKIFNRTPWEASGER